MTVKSIFNDWSKALKIEQLKSDLTKVADDLGKVKNSIVPQAKHTLRQAEREYKQILKQLAMAQKQWNLEVRKAGAFLKRSTHDIEKTLQHYQDLAVQQKNEIQKTIAKPNGAGARTRKTNLAKKRLVKKVGKRGRGRKPVRSVGADLQH